MIGEGPRALSPLGTGFSPSSARAHLPGRAASARTADLKSRELGGTCLSERSKGKQAFTYHLHRGYWRSFCSAGLHRLEMRGNCPNAQPPTVTESHGCQSPDKQENTHEKVPPSRAGVLVILVCFLHCCLAQCLQQCLAQNAH